MKSSLVFRLVAASICYSAAIFALGFAFGIVRTVVMNMFPTVTRLEGVILEVPIILVISWFSCRFLMRHFKIPQLILPRVVLGGLAFMVLIMAEVTFGTLFFSRSLPDHFALYQIPSFALGLAAQITFAAFPVLQVKPA